MTTPLSSSLSKSVSPSAQRVRREVTRLAHAGLDLRTLGSGLLQQLRAVIPFEVSCLLTADPATLLVTGGMADEPLLAACARFSANDLLQDDVNTFASLTRRHTPVGILTEATAGILERSPRYCEILAPMALGDELRAALIANGSCWGFLSLYRERSAPPFSRAEATFLAGLIPHVALGLRKALLLGSVTDYHPPHEPGILLLADDLSVVASTPAAQDWLAWTGKPASSSTPLLPWIISYLVSRLKALEQGTNGQPELPPAARLRMASGHWLHLHACRLSGPHDPGQIAVIFEQARPAEVAPLIVQAYNLTRRESEIVQCVSRGLSTAEIASIFCISANTVQDHLKAIFEKVGVRSRRELIGQIFTQQYQPRIAAGRNLDASGWFS
jgi:DNA-binding CsgD family transcriptional regulator